ncbi:unnamed protein product [Calicophoron daubneyi]|uniref:Ig-like domain-containing protein n=1 Tax=Calicophoron daubneyi TaxID=300641 RepID=A0AAV2TKV1_CALDB
MSDRASSTESSDFSDGSPTTTTISTVAVQAGNARIVLAILRCGNWIRVRIQRMEPDLYDIGTNAAEAQALHEVHNNLCEKLAAKQDQISQLLSRADDLVTQQTSEDQARVYAAMADSLNRAWQDILGVLHQRGHLLDLSVEFHTAAEHMFTQAENVERLCNQGGWGHDVESVRSLIEEHAQLKRTGLLEPAHRMLNAANSLLELLAKLSYQSGPSASYSSSTGAGRASVEAREHIASITAKGGAKRRHAEAVWNRRERLLNLRLAVVSMEAELGHIIDWFVKDGEPRLYALNLGTCLSDCQANLDSLMILADEVRDVQSRHTRLMRNLQQASTAKELPGVQTKSVFETLDTHQQELEMELRRDFGEYTPMEIDGTADSTSTFTEEAWRETHGAYSELANRMRISEAYIWEFLDRIERKRRILQTGVVYYSEINVVLTKIYQLEAEMKEKQGVSIPGQEDAFFDRLSNLEMCVPGLKQTLAEILAKHEEPWVRSALSTQLGFPAMPAVPESTLSSSPISAATGKMQEVEDGIARCRSLFTMYQEKSVRARQRQEIEGRVDMLREWLSQRIQKSLVEHANMGTIPELVTDFEDFHRRLEKELTSREPELEDLRTTVSRLSPSPEKSSLEVRLAELQSEWTKCRQKITMRLRLAENYHNLLKRVREDEYQQNIVLERMRQLDGTSPAIVGSEIRLDSLARLIGAEGPENLRNEVTVAINRLEEQQIRLTEFMDEITQQADRDLSTAEPLHYCQLQIELNTKRLTQLRESWISCERFWDQWKMTREYWAKFTEAANQLDEVMTSSLSRMTRTPLPTTAIECDRAIREHLVEREKVDQLRTTVQSRAQQLGNLVGCRPDDLTESGMGWRFIEVPAGIEAGMPGSNAGRRVRSEMSLRLAGLETGWTAWDKAWATKKIQLERRGAQVGRLATIEEVELEIAKVERNLQTISSSVSLKAPLEQVEKADRDLSQLEAAIPVLETRVLSTAAGPKMQLLQGAPEEMDVSELPIDVTSRQEQLDRRVHDLADAASKCRVEVNITLRLLRAMKVTENSLTQITFNLNEVQQKLHTLPLDDREGIELVRKEMETELIRGQAVADTQIPALEKLAAEHPKPIEAEHHIQPVVSGFRSAISELRRVTEEVRVRSERSIKLTPTPGIPVPEDKMTQQFIAPPALPYRPEAPIITKPLQNVYADEGTSVIMEVEFQSNLPPDANPYDQNQLQATWFKDGVLLQTPDYESRLTPTEAGLRIGETLGEDTGQFNCRISTPYGQAETSGKLTVNVPVSPSAAQRPVEEAAIQPSRQPRERRPAAPLGERPRFVRELTSQTVKETEELNLQCQAVGYPVPKLSWYQDGEPLDNNPDYVITEMAGSGCLKVRQSRMILHEGTYVCKATNNLGEASTTCHVTIHPGNPPIIIRPLHTTALRVGDRCKLTVQYKSALPVEIDWYHRGQPIHSEPDRRRITKEGTDLANLNLPNTQLPSICSKQVTPEDQGEYKCVVRNAIGEVTTVCHLTVNPREEEKPRAPTPFDELVQRRRQRPPERPTAPRRRYDLGPDFDEVFEPSKTRRLSERMVTSEEVTVQKTAERKRFSMYSDESSVLETGRATSVPPKEFTVLLRKRPLVAAPRPASEIIQPPQFIRPLHNAEVTEGQKIRLECTVSGIPSPKIKWLKNGLPLMRSNAYVTKEEGSKHSLVFYDIFLEDKGEYTCVAQNPYGEASTSCRMDVEPVSSGEEAERPPEVIRPLPTQLSVQEGGEVRLECVFSGRPVPTVVWLKDGKQPVTSEEFQPTQEGGVARLYMPHVRPERTGVYQAVATNAVGTCRSTLYLQIVPQPAPVMPSLSRPSTKPIPRGEGPEFTRIFKDVYFESERLEEIVLECTVTAVPPPDVYWTHNGRLITGEDNRYVPIQGPGPNDYCLIIRHPDATVAGRYQMVAENIHGRVTCSALVHPMVYTPALGSRPPSLWSLNRITTRRHIQTREYSVPPSPATTISLIMPTPPARPQPLVSPVRLQRETSAPPSQQYFTQHHLQLVPRQATPPVQVTFPLPRKERSLSRSEITRTLESQLPSKGMVRHYSSTQFLNAMHVTPMVPQYSSSLTSRVSSQPHLSPGYSSEEEHDHPMSVMPMVKHYRTRMEHTLTTQPRYVTEAEHRQQMSVTPMVPEFRTRLDHRLSSMPELEAGYATEAKHNVQMEVVPLVPEYTMNLRARPPFRSTMRRMFGSEQDYLNKIEIRPVTSERIRYPEHEFIVKPALRESYSVEDIHEHRKKYEELTAEYQLKRTKQKIFRPYVPKESITEKLYSQQIQITPKTAEYTAKMELPITKAKRVRELLKPKEAIPKYTNEAIYIPTKQRPKEVSATITLPKPTEKIETRQKVMRETRKYRSQVESKVASHPPLVAGHVSEQEHELQMDVVPVVPEYKTELSTDVISRPELTSGHETRLDYERALEVEARRTEYITELATEVTAKPELQPGHVSATEHLKQMEVTPMVPEYKTELESKVASHPPLVAGHVSEQEHELQMDVVPVVPEYKTELSTDVISRPELTSGHETRLDYERALEVEARRTEYITELATEVTAKPELQPGHVSATEHLKQMEVTPMVPEYKTELESKVASHPPLVAGHVSEQEHELQMDVVPVVPEYKTELSTDVISRPELTSGHETRLDYERALEVEARRTEYITELATEVTAKPELQPGHVSATEHLKQMEVTPMVPEYKTELESKVASHPPLVAGHVSEQEHELQMDVVPVVPEYKTELSTDVISRPELTSGHETRLDYERALEVEARRTEYITELATEVTAKPELQPGHVSATEHLKQMEVTPMVPEYKTELESKVASHPPLVAGHVSEQEHELQMDVVPVVPEYKTELSTDVISRPELTSGHETRLDYERALEVEARRTEYITELATEVTAKPELQPGHVSATEHLKQMEVTPMVPEYKTELESKVASHPPLVAGHVSEQEHELQMDVVPVVPEYKTELSTDVISRPELTSGHETRLDYERALEVEARRTEYITELATEVTAKPELQPGHVSATEHLKQMEVTPMVPEYKTELESKVASHPPLVAGHVSEQEHELQMDVVPVVPEYKTELSTDVISRPELTSGHETRLDYERALEVEARRTEYITELATEVTAKPELQPGHVSATEHLKQMEVTPMVPEYKTELESKVASHPPLVAGHVSEQEHELQMDVVPVVPEYKTELSTDVISRPELTSGHETRLDYERALEVEARRTEYITELATEVTAKPELQPGHVSATEHLKQMEVTPMVPEYKTELESKVASHPPLVAGHVSEQEHELQMDVVPVVPEYKTELSTDVISRPELTSGHETRLDYERALEVEARRTEYITELATEVTAKPELQPGHVSATEHLKQMEVTPMVPEYKTELESKVASHPPLVAGHVSEQEHELQMDVVPVVPEYKTELSAESVGDFGPTFATRVVLECDAFASQFPPVDMKVDVPIPPQFLKPLSSILATEGTCITMEGIVTGKPEPTVAWLKGGKEISEGPDFQMYYADGHVSLTLLKPSTDYSGEYTCAAQNVAGSAESTATIIVQASLVAPRFIKGLENQMIKEGQPVKMVVKVEGYPSPTVVWKCNGREITSSEHYITEVVGDGTHVLNILDTQIADTGRYTVTAKNPAGESVSTGFLTMQGTQEEVMHYKELTVQVEGLKQKPVTELVSSLTQPERPYFTQVYPPELELVEGEQLVLKVEAWGNPLPFIHWLHNGNPLEDKPECQLSQLGPALEQPEELQAQPVRMTGQLIIREVSPDDSGLYTCVAVNKYGQSEVLGNINISPKPTVPVPETAKPLTELPIMEIPKFTVLPPPQILAQLSQPLIIEAEAKGNPMPEMTLYHNGQLLGTDKDHLVEIIPGAGRIRMQTHQFQPSDEGEWTIVATNAAGTASSALHIFLMPKETQKPELVARAVPVSPVETIIEKKPVMTRPMFTERLPTTAESQEGVPLTLSAKFRGQPTPSVRWLRNGKPLEQTERIQYTFNGVDTVTLSLLSPSREDIGVYTCSIENQAGKDSCSVSIRVAPTIQPAPKPTSTSPPRFLRGPLPWPITETGELITCPGQLDLPEGKPVSLEVDVIGQPTPEVSWFHQSQPILADNFHKTFIRRKGTYVLLLNSPSVESDSGQYSCVATNNVGQAILQFSVQVQPSVRPPRFIEKPAPQITAAADKPLVLRAQVEGVPKPVLSWHKDGKLVSTTQDGRVNVEFSDYETVVTIRAVSRDDLGKWQCLAANTAGTVSARTTIEIPPETVSGVMSREVQPETKGKPMRAPRFVQFLQPVTAIEASEVSFLVQFDGEPAPQVTWMRDGVNLETKADYKITTTETTSQLIIPEVFSEDGGVYSVTLRNPAGQANSKSRLLVEVSAPKQLGSPPKFQQPLLQPVTVKVGEPVTFESKVLGEPLPQVHWEHDGTPIPITGLQRVHVSDTPPSHTLTILATQPEDAGEYRCVAVNPFGTDVNSTRLTVERPVPHTVSPRFVVPLPHGQVKVNEGEPVQLEVQFEGVPRPDIKWLRNGQPFRPTPEWKVITEEYYSRLECREVFQSDSAEWTVQATSPSGHAKTETQLVVVPVVPAPEAQITSPPVFRRRVQSHLKVPLHHTATLQCTVSGTPEPTLRWFHNGVEFQPHLITAPQEEPSAKQELLVDRATHSYTLYIRDLNAFDVGEIMVRAENELGVTMCTSVLELDIIEGQLVGPRFVRQLPERLEVRPGDTARLECEVESQPPVGFRWYVNGLQLDRTTKEYQVLEDVNRTTLVIPRIEVGDLPTLVKIEAAAQTGTKIVSTSVIEMIASADQTDTFYEKPVEVVTRETPIRFTKQLPQVFVIDRERHKVTLEVEIEKPADMMAETSPKPVFSWYMNGIELFLTPTGEQSDRYHITQDSAWHSRLVIDQPSEIDVGDITCAVSRVSSTGEERVLSTCHIELPDKSPKSPQPQLAARTELLFAPQFAPGLPATIKPELGSSVVFDLTVRANPKSEVNWSVSSPVTAERCEIMPPTEVDEVTTKYRMILHEFRSEDRNTVIEAVAISELGQATTICQLESPAEAPAPKGSETINVEFAKALSPEIEVPLTESVALECAVQPTSVPVEFHWYVNGTEVNSDMPLFDIKSTEFTSTLEIEEMKEEFVGPVSVSVISSQGQLLSEGKLQIAREAESLHIETESVQPIPERPDMIPADEFRFKKPVTAEIHAKEQSLILECQIESAQQPVQVHWKLEGRDLFPSDKMEMVYLEDTGLSRLVVHQPIPSDSGKYSCVATQPKIEEQGVAPRSIISSASVTVEEHLAEEVVQPFEVVSREEVPSKVVEKAELLFIKPVSPELKTTAAQELQLEYTISWEGSHGRLKAVNGKYNELLDRVRFREKSDLEERSRLYIPQTTAYNTAPEPKSAVKTKATQKHPDSQIKQATNKTDKQR